MELGMSTFVEIWINFINVRQENLREINYLPLALRSRDVSGVKTPIFPTVKLEFRSVCNKCLRTRSSLMFAVNLKFRMKTQRNHLIMEINPAHMLQLPELKSQRRPRESLD